MCNMTQGDGSYPGASKSQNLSMIRQSHLSRKHTRTGGRSRLVLWARDSGFLTINSPVKCRAGHFPLSNKMALKKYILFISGHKYFQEPRGVHSLSGMRSTPVTNIIDIS